MSTECRQRFAGEVIWITGASSGMGRALAVALAAEGAKVIASARSSDALQRLAEEHPTITPLVFDVSDSTAVGKTWDRLSAMTNYLDRVILNAGTCEYLDIDNPDWQMMRRTMDVNYFGAINTLDVALPLLQSRPGGHGHIIGVASLATVVPFARAEAYGASKAALQYFLDSLRVDLRKQTIDVTVVNPGFIKTPLTDKNDFTMPLLLSADVAAQRIVNAIWHRPRQYDFPRRLKWMLKLLGLIPAVWYSVVAPRLEH